MPRSSRLCAQRGVIAQLTTAPGLGPVVATAFVSVVDEAKRFRHAHQLASYLGLVPLGGHIRAQSVEQQAQAMKRATVKARRRQRSIDKGLDAAAATATSRPTSTSRRASMN